MSDTLTAPASSGSAAVPAIPAIPIVPSAPLTDPTAGYAAARDELKAADSWDALVPPADADPAAEPPASPDAPVVDGEFVQDEQGRWHRADGTFANDTELAAITA